MTLNLDQYRSSREYREILRILQRSTTLEENFIWQSFPQGKNVIPVHHFEIDFVAREVVVLYDSSKYEVDPNRNLYIKLDYRTSVFKVSSFRLEANTLHFSFPEEIKTQELRVNPRYKVSQGEEKQVSLKPSTGHGAQEKGMELVAKIEDISYFGLGLIVSEQNRIFLKNNRILWVTRLDKTILTRPILAEVVYIRTLQDGSYTPGRPKEIKVGLRLSGVFPEEIFNDFVHSI